MFGVVLAFLPHLLLHLSCSIGYYEKKVSTYNDIGEDNNEKLLKNIFQNTESEYNNNSYF